MLMIEEVEVTCTYCQGKGKWKVKKTNQCPVCRGNGSIRSSLSGENRDCMVCDGRGDRSLIREC